MKTLEILGANRFDSFSKTRPGSRAVIVRDGMILLSHETVSGWWLIAGGGMEAGETPEECCVREFEEEKRGSYLREHTALQEYLKLKAHNPSQI